MEFLLDYAVAFTSMLLQSGSIKHRDVTAAVTDQTSTLQIPGGFRDAFTAYAKHAGNQFLRHGQFIRGQAIKGQQQPATQLLLHRMVPIADRSLGYLIGHPSFSLTHLAMAC